MSDDMPTCATCFFWYTVFGETGECRRHAPRPYTFDATKLDSESTPDAVFPRTYEDDWCGEHPEIVAMLRARRPP
jgi:hypothetical protein